MNKIARSFKLLSAIIRSPRLLRKVLEDDELWRAQLRKTHGIEEALPVITLEDLFGEFSQVINTMAFLDGSSMPTDLALLKSLAAGIPHCKYFEIGTWRGESVVNVADSAENCYTLNLSEEEMRKQKLPEEYIAQHGFFSRGKPNITHLHGDSRNFDFAGLDQKFDLVFIDGDHHYKMVRNDTEKVFAHLTHPSTIVVWHDYAFNPEKIRHEVMAGILDGVPSRFRRNIYHVANTLCAVYLPKPVQAGLFRSPARPGHRFRVTIELNS